MKDDEYTVTFNVIGSNIMENSYKEFVMWMLVYRWLGCSVFCSNLRADSSLASYPDSPRGRGPSESLGTRRLNECVFSQSIIILQQAVTDAIGEATTSKFKKGMAYARSLVTTYFQN